MWIRVISSEDVVIDLSGEKAESKYINIKDKYSEIIQACQKVVNLSINVSYSLIEQDTLDRIINDIFYMPILDQDEERVFHHKFFDLRKISVQVESSQLMNVDFISNFFHYYNMNSIELSCNSSMIAYSFLNLTKQSTKIENILCENYFSKYFGVYSIESSSFFKDSVEIWGNIYDQIEDLKVNISSDTFETMLGRLVKSSMIRKLEIELLSLQNVEKNTKTLIQQLSINCKQLNKLILKVYDDQLLPPIKIEAFQEKCQLEVQYMSALSHISIGQLLRKINSSVQHQQILQIPSFVDLKDNELKLDFFSRLFSDEENEIRESEKKKIDDKENDIKELMRFLSKSASELDSLEVTFSDSQVFFPSRWVEMLKILCSNQNLKIVKLTCACVSPQLSTLSLAKFVKSGKIRAEVNNSFLKEGLLELQLHQMSHNVLNILMAGNCLREGASYFDKLSIDSDTIIGDFQPFSAYFKTAHHSFKRLSINITKEDPDLMQLLVSAVSDSLALSNTTDQFNLTQSQEQCKSKQCFSFWFSHHDKMTLSIKNKYDITSILHQISDSEHKKITQNLANMLTQQLLFLRSYSRNEHGALSFQAFVKKLNLLQAVWSFHNTCIQENNLTFQLSVFFKIIGVEIPLNPFMLVSDLYYD